MSFQRTEFFISTRVVIGLGSYDFRSVAVLISIFLFIFGCGGDENSTTKASELQTTAQSKVHNQPVNSDALIMNSATKDGLFELEMQQISLVDVGLHPKAKASILSLVSVGANESGPRLMIRGRIKNNSDKWIVDASVRANLTLCRGDCIDKSSHGRGFILKVNGQEPWLPGAWRHFVSVTRPGDPIFRHLRPKAIGKLELEIRAFNEKKRTKRLMWQSDLNWDLMRGYPLQESIIATQKRKLPKVGKLTKGESATILGVSGNAVLVRLKKRIAWVDLALIPEAHGVVSKRQDKTPLPASRTSERSVVTVKSVKTLREDNEAQGKPTEQLLLVEIEINAFGEGKKSISVSKRNFTLSTGGQEIVKPEKYSSPDSFNFKGRINVGESRSGVIAFKLPIGTDPVALRIELPQHEPWKVISPKP